MAKAESVSHDVVRGRPRRGPTYLVARGASWFFQIRVPEALTPTRRLPPLRVKLTVDSRRTAQRKAAVLAAYATDAFARWTSRETGVADAEQTRRTVWWDIGPSADGNIEPFLESLRLLEQRLSAPPRTDHLSLDALIGMKSLGEIVAINREAADENGHPLVHRNADLLREQTIRRWRLATDGPVPDGLQLLIDRLAELQVGQAHLLERFSKSEIPAVADGDCGAPTVLRSDDPGVPKAKAVDGLPLFSEVAAQYLEVRQGAGTTGVGTARYRLDVFLDVVGDRRIDEYRPIDLQRYVNELQFLPRAFRSDRPEARAFDGMSASQAIEANRELRWEPLGIKTLQDGYVQVVKATASFAAAHHPVRHPFAGIQIRWPANLKPSVQRSALDHETMDRVFKVGVASGYLDDALLLPLSFLTSRRIGLLAFLRGSDLVDRHGVTTVQVNGIVFDSKAGSWRRVPYKTDESLRFFVLHDLFRQIGFVDWAKAQGDAFLFRALQQVQDPAAVASQRANRLLDRAGARSRFVDVAHSFRHGAKDLMSDDMIDETSSRLQMGHEISGVHAEYGRRPELRRKECMKLAAMKLPTEIDWSIFKSLDFEALALKERVQGRPKNR